MNRISIRKLYFLLVISFGAAFCGPTDHIILTPRLQALLDDMKFYKLDSEGDAYLHAGDLYEHSIWTHNAMLELFKGDFPYASNLHLTQRNQEIVALAALLHDIGKAGRKELFDFTHPRLRYDVAKNENGSIASITYYQDHQEHPRISFEYAAKPVLTEANKEYVARDYYVIDKNSGLISPFDISQLYNELGITVEEQKIMAILIGIHYEFGSLKHNKITNRQFLMKLQSLAMSVGYNQGNLDEHMVRLAILIQVADVKGLLPVSAYPTKLFPEGITCMTTHSPTKFTNTLIGLNYIIDPGCSSEALQEPIGVTVMNKLLAYFNEHYQQKNGARIGEECVLTNIPCTSFA